MKKKLLLTVILMMIMSSCASLVGGFPTAEVTSTPTDAPVPTVTPTLEPTLTPTVTPMPYPTPTLMLTPTPVEWELVPYIEKAIEYEWRGVLIKARLIIDDSLSSKIESIEISDELLAEMVARAMFFVWVQRKGGTSWMLITPSDINEYMEMWATAQDSGLESDWRKVQVDDIWANDLTDGNGYVQSRYDVWPMYYGEDAPDGVTPLNTLTIAFVSNEGFDNVTFILGNHMSAGTNLNDGDFLIYRGFDEEWLKSIPNGSTLEQMYLSNLVSTGTWLAWNDNGVFNSDMFGDRTISSSKLRTAFNIKLR